MALQKLTLTAAGITSLPDRVNDLLGSGRARYLNFIVSGASDLKGGTLQLVMKTETNGVNGATQDAWEAMSGLNNLVAGDTGNHDFVGADGYGFELSGSLTGTPAVVIYYAIGG
jgi:hypothetical protein